jgi:hypothetical protein
VAVSVARAFQPEHSASAFGCLEIAAAGLGAVLSHAKPRSREGVPRMFGAVFFLPRIGTDNRRWWGGRSDEQARLSWMLSGSIFSAAVRAMASRDREGAGRWLVFSRFAECLSHAKPRRGATDVFGAVFFCHG